MKPSYQSTRDANIQATAKQAIAKGIAPDGGLFVRPDLGDTKVDLDRILEGDYISNAAYILDILLDDYSESELKELVSAAYTGTFDDPALTPLVPVGKNHVLELFHGPTSAFKDMALTLLPHLMKAALAKEGKKALILTATSGDTGKAALSGFQDVDGTAIAVFYPDGKVSDIQYRQMACQEGGNVAVFALEGNFDDAQSQVKRLFLDEELNERLSALGWTLSSANSINVGRLVPQVVYYFEAWKQLVKAGKIGKEEELVFSVPTGNFGDVLAGFYAMKLGLPVKKFIVASNANDVLTSFIETGTYDRNRPFLKTISPSMDILISSNLERLLYYLTDGDTDKVAGWMKQLQEEGKYTIDPETLEKLQALFSAASLDDDATRAVIKQVKEETGYVLDPHSAIGYGAVADGDGTVVCLATASPFKFSQDVLKALSEEVADGWTAMHRLEEVAGIPAPAGLASLETAPILHETVLTPAEMKSAVIAFAGGLK